MFYQDIVLLQQLTLPGSSSEALTFLNRVAWYGNLQFLKNHFFPKEELIFDDWAALTEERPTKWELEFFNLINESFFPMPEPMLIGEDMFTTIPAWPYYPNWYDSEIEDLPKSFQLIVHLLSNLPTYFTEKCEWLEDISIDVDEDVEINTEILDNLCSEYGAPLHILPTILQILDGETGNVWLDATTETYLEFEWSIDNIDLLKEHWDGAVAVANQIDALDEWLEEGNHIHLFLNLWSECYKTEPIQEPQPLITVLRELYADISVPAEFT
ncbi:MAG: hypothetical protein ICV78_18230 [Tolypothrix sp. Co-bin9]|nr:hypothetical protein [Tolypothrix sp. Co-bin9]